MRSRKPSSRGVPRRGLPTSPEPSPYAGEPRPYVPPYTPIQPPPPQREEPWYDTRYQPPTEEPRDRVGARYRGGPDPNYAPDDYAEMPRPPGPQPMMFDGRAPGPRPHPAPPERLPTYQDTVRSAALRPLWERTAPLPDDPAFPDGALAEATDEPNLPTGDGLDALLAPGGPAAMPGDLAGPPATIDELANVEPPPPWPSEDPLALANQAFDDQMQQAFSPPPPEPDPWANPLMAYGGLEQHLLEPPDLPLCPDLPPM